MGDNEKTFTRIDEAGLATLIDAVGRVVEEVRTARPLLDLVMSAFDRDTGIVKLFQCAYCGHIDSVTGAQSGHAWTCEKDPVAIEVRHLREENRRIEDELEGHAWKISPGMAQAKIDSLNAQVDRLRDFARDVRDNYDHEEDAHRYRNGACRCCNAEKVVGAKEETPRE